MAKMGTTEGLAIREVVKELGYTAITIKKYVKYNVDEEEKYNKKFNNLKDLGKITKGEYEGNRWVIKLNHYKNTLKFDMEFNRKITSVIKAYIIVSMNDRHITPDTIHFQFNVIKNVIHKTNFFDNDYIEEFEDYLFSFSKTSIVDAKYALMSFLYFYPPNNMEYVEIVERINGLKKCKRELPPYKSIVWFDDIINEYSTNCDIEDKLIYMPLFLWWKITNVIPLRVLEFLQLKKNCCWFDENKKEYYIKVPRLKQKYNPVGRIGQVKILHELKITKDIYDLIQEYIKLTSGYIQEESEFLLNKIILANVSQYNNSKHVVNDRASYDQITHLLSKFYDDVIKVKYGFNVVKNKADINEENLSNTLIKVKLGDTRHLAFCSMMLQGFNPLSIAQIGGHETLAAQNHYISHLNEFSDANVLMLTKHMKSYLNTKIDAVNTTLTSREVTMLSYNNYDKISIKPIELDDGYCYSLKFPRECKHKECIFCSYFRLNFKKLPDTILYEKLNMKLSSIETEMKAKLDFIKRQMSNLSSNKNIIVEDKDENLVRATGELYQLSRQKAIVGANVEILKEV
ncbi:hypothetical protein [Clostridium estertheticum]|uniref:hypothetical protein n=1 Tax=Clostridium estertheticum TaxID=238834 RepID=UPI001C0C2363|nr:hypothetical protein [Clostridium estertheticum]MBU3187890.1 hypothetical protein [Clostridium estertheticum]